MELVWATKEKSRARVALVGPPGAGKTFTSLKLATSMCERVGVICSERGSAAKYANKFKFQIIVLDSFHPHTYTKAIKIIEQAGCDGLVIDSLSHAWNGTNGALELVDNAAARSKSNNKFFAWREVTPLHNELVDAILQSPMHVFVTMRAKVEYVVEVVDGKQVPRKVGLAPIQREGLEYEFDIVADMDQNHTLMVSKSRCEDLDGAVIHKPDERMAQTIKDWVTDGVLSQRELKLQAFNKLATWAESMSIDGKKLRVYGKDCPDVPNDPRLWTPEDCQKLRTYIECLLSRPETASQPEFEMAARNQIARIHLLYPQKGIKEQDYRTMLADMYNGKTSSKELTFDQASEFISFLETYIPPETLTASEKQEGPYPWEVEH